MAPAIRPAFSCSAPSSVEIDWAVACVKLSGSAPYFSWLASSVADSWSKLPEISGAAGDRLVDRRRGDDLAVQGDADLLADVGTGVLGPRRGARRVEVQLDDPLARALTRAGAGVGDVGALDHRGAEQVLGRAVLAAGGDVVLGAVHGADGLAVTGERGVGDGRLLLGDRGGVRGDRGRRRIGRRRTVGRAPRRPSGPRRRPSAWRPRRSVPPASVGVALSVAAGVAGSGPCTTGRKRSCAVWPS